MLHSKYRPDIDGLRALAVLSVLLFHFFPNWLPGGFVGVDIFFVISGYLITGIILSNLEAGTFSFFDFYIRRVRRIFPALLVVLFACMAAGWYLMLPDEFTMLGKHIVSASTYIANLTFWQEAGYFDADSGKKVLLHLWSLGIEEQFYVFWPLVVWLLAKRGRGFLKPALALTVLSFVANLWMAHVWPVGDFYSPFSRAWELAAGAILACVDRRHPELLADKRPLLAVAGTLLTFGAIVLLNSDKTFPGAWALLPVLGAFGLIAGGAAAWPNRMVLANPAAAFIGKISYPLYLWHWPLLAFGTIIENGLPSRPVRIALMLASFPLAWLTYHLVEPAFRFKATRGSLAVLMGGSVVSAVMGVLIWCAVLPPRHNDRSLEPVMAAAREDTLYPPPGFYQTRIGDAQILTKGTSHHATLFVGDSHMQQYIARIDQDVEKLQGVNAAVILTHESCPAFAIGPPHQGCAEMHSALSKLLPDIAIDTVVIGERWSAYAVPASDPGLTQFRNGFAKLLDRLRGKRVFVILDNPSGPQFDPVASVQGSRFGILRYAGGTQTVARPTEDDAARQAVIAVAKAHGVTLLDAMALICRGKDCTLAMNDGTLIYKDTNHLRDIFVRRHADFISTTMAPRFSSR